MAIDWNQRVRQVPLSLSDLPGLRVIGEKRGGQYYVQKRINGKPTRIWLTFQDEGDDACRKSYSENVTPQSDDSVASLLHAWLAYEERLAANGSPDALSAEYLKSCRKRLNTRALYNNPRTGEPTVYGLVPYFGHMAAPALPRAAVRQYLTDCRALGRAIAGNREKSMLSSMYNWAMNNPEQFPWTQDNDFINPCYGVAQNKERPSKKYAEDHEVERFKTYASPALAILIDGAWMTGIRGESDLFRLEDKHIRLLDVPVRDKEGNLTGQFEEKMFIDWTENKTGKENLMELGPVARSVIERALAYRKERASRLTIKLKQPRQESTFVFTNLFGDPWTKSGVGSAWGAAREAAIRDGWRPNFSFRTIRAKAQTDTDENVIGHAKGGRMREVVYTRNRRRLKSLR